MNQTAAQPEVTTFYDESTNTFSYIVSDPLSQHCAVIDPVLDFEGNSGTISYQSANQIISRITDENLILDYLIETHVHADHLSAAPYIQEELGGEICIGTHITVVQDEFGKLFNEGTRFQRDGSQFDILFEDNHEYQIGALSGRALHTPGHTPACMTHVIGDAAFVGDTLFQPDAGTARADFPGGDARALYKSIQKILSLPETTRLYMCHDYPPEGRSARSETTVAQQRAKNIHVHTGIVEDEFVSLREARDATLRMPELILPSLQVNIRAGHFPEAEDNETVYLKTPIRGLKTQSKK